MGDWFYDIDQAGIIFTQSNNNNNILAFVRQTENKHLLN